MLERDPSELKVVGLTDRDIVRIDKILNNLPLDDEINLVNIISVMAKHPGMGEEINWIGASLNKLSKTYKSKLDVCHSDLYRDLRLQKASGIKMSESEIFNSIISDPKYLEIKEKKELIEKWVEYFTQLIYTMNHRQKMLSEISVDLRALNNVKIE